MATTLHNRVEDYIGPRDTNTALEDWLTAMSEWLTASAREIFEAVPLSRLEMFTPAPAAVPTTGLTMAGKRIVEVTGNDRPCRKIPNGTVAQAKSSASIHYSDGEDPVFYVKGGSIYVVYDAQERAGVLHYIESPLVDYDQTAIAYFPTEFETIVVLGAAIRARIRQIADRRVKLRFYTETEEDLELAQGVMLEIQTMQAEMQALQASYQQELQILMQGTATP